MKLINKPVEMIAYHTKDGIPTPVKFKILEDDTVIIKVGRIIESHQKKLNSKKMLVFICESIIDDIEKRYELRMDSDTLRWTLYKM